MNPPTGSETLDLLREALETAKVHYESTKCQFELVMKPANGGRSQRPSIQDLEEAHKEAIQKYRRALLDFNHFIFESRHVIDPKVDGFESKPDGLASKPGARDIPETEQ